jgi:C4-dicarboxylate-specific signal transduction histidine kinase
VEVRADDEVGRLAQTFNDMIDSVEERTERLRQEIAERLRVEGALRESERSKLALLDAVPDHMLRIDADGMFLETRGNQRDFIMPPARFLGKRLVDILPRGAASRSMRAVRQALDQRQMVTVEFRLPYRRGWRFYEARVVPVGEAEVLAMVRNITEQKEAERARADAERRLEGQRTLSLRSDRLRSLGEMAAGIAHELNQPLVGVRGMAEHALIAMDRGWDQDQTKLRRRLGDIIGQVDRMSHTIQHVRLFAREAGSPRLDDVSLTEVAEAARDLLQTQFSAHGLDLRVELAAQLPTIRANQFSLEEAVLNLLTNARDAVESSAAPTVTLRTWQPTPDRVGLEVADNGVGIAADIRERIWQPFFTTKDPDKGTGLGLAITRTIVEQFGGRVELDTEVGGGTRIQFLFDVVRADAPSRPAVSPQEPPAPPR